MPSVMVIAGLMMVASCKEDEEPKSGVSFSVADQEVYESDGTIEVLINLSKALSEKAVIGYTLSGTAVEDEDFEISPVGGYITIGPGATQFIVEIEVYEDGDVEYDFDEEIGFETIILTLDEVVSGPAQLNGELTHTVSVYEDDLLILLGWEGGTTDVDMDMFVWIDDPETATADYGIISPNFVGGVNADTEFEFLVLRAGFPDADYAFSYVYYSGTSDDLDFSAQVINFGGTINDATSDALFDGNYSLANINPWDTETGTDPLIRQYATKNGLNYEDFTDIDLSAPGTSRLQRPTVTLPKDLKRMSATDLEKIKRIVELY